MPSPFLAGMPQVNTDLAAHVSGALPDSTAQLSRVKANRGGSPNRPWQPLGCSACLRVLKLSTAPAESTLGWQRGPLKRGPCLCGTSSLVRVNVYVDGFNLYYGAVKGTPFRWLDLRRLSQRILKAESQINRIRYFTALVDGRDDPATPRRQQTYLRALGTIPNLTVHYGSFVTHPKTLPLVAGGGMARVLRTDEKGSDVNLASHLLLDAFDGDFETALIVSNDSDLAFPIRAVRKRLGLTVGVACPVARNSRPSRLLVEAADFRFHLTRKRRRLLRDSQFPERLVDSVGKEILKPANW